MNLFFFFLVLCLSSTTTVRTTFASHVQEEQASVVDYELDNNIPEGTLFLNEEFTSFGERTVARMREQEEEEDDSFLLRGRGLQTSSPTCTAVTPLNFRRPQGQLCRNLPRYPCTCTGGGITETTCSYCALRPDNTKGVRCQVSGSLITFRDQTNTVTTCGCNYIGNGQVHQFCFQASVPVPVPAPAVVVEDAPPSPVAVPTGAPVAGPTTLSPVPRGGGGGGKKGKDRGGHKRKRRM